MYKPPRSDQITAPGLGGGASYGRSPTARAPDISTLRDRRPHRFGPAGKGVFFCFTIRPPAAGLAEKSTTVRPSRSVAHGQRSGLRRQRKHTAGYFMAFHAKTGELAVKFNTGSGVFSSPSMYWVKASSSSTVGSAGAIRGRRAHLIPELRRYPNGTVCQEHVTTISAQLPIRPE